MIPTVSELRSIRRQLEAGIEQLWKRLNEAEVHLAALKGSLAGNLMNNLSVQQQEELVLELRREIQRRKIAICDLDERISAVETEDHRDRLRQLQHQNEAIKSELELLRRDLLKSLLGMADVLRRQQKLSAEKMSMSAELSKLSGNDYAYENYISCALLHSKDYWGDVQFVVESLKKIRPVS